MHNSAVLFPASDTNEFGELHLLNTDIIKVIHNANRELRNSGMNEFK
jgi:hypothetical protein